ncbi:MAG: T9SS type A sorting domain-containing protein, partial [Bacteroidales bacterium]|nr:T9SS type A sorting domain-containing protein [Bacteroidales bacterium]
GSDMRKTSDGGFLIAGSAYLDYKPYAMIARLDGEGNQIWAEAHDNGNSMTFMVNVTETQDLGAAAIGYTYNSGDYHIYFLKTDTLGLVTTIPEVLKTNDNIVLGPNPVQDLCHIQFEQNTRQIHLLDMQGRTLLSHNITTGQTSIKLSLGHLPSGVYLLRITSQKGEIIKKLVKW